MIPATYPFEAEVTLNTLPTQRRTFPTILRFAIASLLLVTPPAKAKAEDALKIGSLQVGKILFLGNSITQHGPAPDIGWTGDWGMAASAREKDYVHLLMDQISKAAGKRPKFMVRNIADFERQLTDYKVQDALKMELAFEADLIILAIGENTPTPTTDEARKRLADALRDLLTQLTKQGRPTLIVRSQFWAEPVKDELLKKACENAGGIFVDLAGLGLAPANAAKSERQIDHLGVAGHPGDKGMAAIAAKLWNAIQEAGKLKK